VRQYVDQLWPSVDPTRVLLRLFSDAAFLARCAEGILTDSEQATLVWSKPAKGPGSAKWSLADAVLVDEAADLIERTASLGHVVLDEAQDLSPMMLRAVGRRCATGSATVLGDLAQATTPWSTRSWAEALSHLGKPGAHIEELTVGFRVPADVIAYAARLLPLIAPQLIPPSSVRKARGDLRILRTDDVIRTAVRAVEEAGRAEGSIGLIAPARLTEPLAGALAEARLEFARLGDESDVDARIDLVPASLAKGLEFDHVVLVEPSAIVSGEPDHMTGLRRVYVCLTRAVTSLVVVHQEELPIPL